MKKAYLNWSSGKDAIFSLFKIQQTGEYSIEKLVTTVNTSLDKVSMHDLDVQLLELQAKNIGIPLQLIELPGGEVPMETYNEIMKNAVIDLKNEGYNYSIFGDIFLEDLKQYREDNLSRNWDSSNFSFMENGY